MEGPTRAYRSYYETYNPPTISATRELPDVGFPTRYFPARTWHLLSRGIALFYPRPATRGLLITRRIKLHRIPLQTARFLPGGCNGQSRGPSVLHRYGCLVSIHDLQGRLGYGRVERYPRFRSNLPLHIGRAVVPPSPSTMLSLSTSSKPSPTRPICHQTRYLNKNLSFSPPYHLWQRKMSCSPSQIRNSSRTESSIWMSWSRN